MSEFLAEARILVRPDTTTFRQDLIAQLAVASRGVAVPVPITATPVTTAAASSLLAATSASTTAIRENVAELEKKGAAEVRAAATSRGLARETAQVEKALLANTAGFLGLRGAVLTAGTAFIGATIAFQAFAKSVGLAAQLEEELNVFRVTAQATGAQMRDVSEAAQELGRDISLPGVSAVDAAQSMSLLARAGLSVSESIAATRGVLQFATAAQVDYATSVELTAGALNAFGLQGTDAVRVADVLANAANESQASITDMGLALRQSAAVARQVGLSLEETVAQLTILARAGIVGSDAGTSLRVALTRLVAPTEAAQKALNSLNIELRDADDTFRADVFAQIGDAIQGLNATEQAALLFRIFGQDAQRVVSILAREGRPALDETTAALSRMGAAAELAAARSQGLSGEARALQSNFETLGTTLGTAVLPFLSSLTRGLNIAVGGINTLVGAIDGLSGEGFEEANASFAELVNRIAEIQDLRASFVAPEVEELSERVRTLGEELSRLGATDRVVAAFRQASTEIDAALQDGVITPLERAQLETDALGRAFLSVAPKNILTGLGADVRSGLEDATATARVGVEDLGAEIRSGIEDMSREAAVAAREGGEEVGDSFAEGLRAAASRITGQIAGLGEQITRASIAGDDRAELALLQQQQERLRRLLAIQEDIVAQGGAGAATARERIRQQILPQLEGIGREIEAILDAQVRETEELANDAERKRDERDANILRALGLQEQRRENAVIRAQADDALRNDLQAQIALREFYERALQEVRKTVTDAVTKSQAIAQLTRDLIRAQQAVRETRRALRDELRREAEERQQERDRARELNLEFAEITGNESAQRRILQQIIKNLEKRIAGMKGISNKERELRNELARRRKQLQELQGEQQETDRTAQRFFFEQLQAQQGFAANLLGNLIPRDQTAGLVGVPAPPSPGRQIQAEARAAAGRAQTGPTSGQVSATNDILLRILEQLKSLNNAASAPEAVYQKKMGAAAMSGGGGNVEAM